MSSSPIPPIPKRVRTKVQTSRDSFDARVHHNSKSSKDHKGFNQYLYLISKKIHDLIPNDKLQRYVNLFLNKPIEFEYFVNKLVETELGEKFIAPLEEHSMLKFLSLNKKFDMDLIKTFYCNLIVASDGLECQFNNKMIKFTKKHFDTHFGVWSKENKFYFSNAPNFVKIDMVKSITKSDFSDRLDMENFNIRQIKFEMRTLHWIIVKMLYMKPRN